MTKFKKNPLITTVFVNSVFAFLIDFVLGLVISWEYVLIVTIVSLLLIYTIYKLFDRHYWAYVISIIYYFLRSINLYFDKFTFFSKNGINIELKLNDTLGINTISLLMLILIIISYKRGQRKTYNYH